ncbi:GlcG/HbpS family heme-binding protein [Flavobacterium saccharophilum]|nr:heme-binding protein [Flavobacterium saccharophilum]
MNVKLNQSEKIIEAAKAKAKEIGVAMNIAIVDEGANLKCFLRMDGALLGCADIAIKKAKTSRFFDIDSGEIGKLSQPGGSLYNIEHSNGGLISFAGGVLLKDRNNKSIGAIGVSGGSVEQDREVAIAGANALQNRS